MVEIASLRFIQSIERAEQGDCLPRWKETRVVRRESKACRMIQEPHRQDHMGRAPMSSSVVHPEDDVT